MDGVDAQGAGPAVRRRVDLADQPVAVQDGQREVAPAALRDRLEHLQLVVELEQLGHAPAVVDEAVERRQQRRPPGERPAELGGIDPPGAPDAVDDGGLAGRFAR
nr:hypothetical protein [Jiangella alba]